MDKTLKTPAGRIIYVDFHKDFNEAAVVLGISTEKDRDANILQFSTTRKKDTCNE